MFYIGALTAIKVRYHHQKFHPCRFNPYGKLPMPAHPLNGNGNGKAKGEANRNSNGYGLYQWQWAYAHKAAFAFWLPLPKQEPLLRGIKQP